MHLDPIVGKLVRFPPGRLQIRLTPEHRSAYRRLYARYGTVLDGLPALRNRDFDGRTVTVTSSQLEALNRAFADHSEPHAASTAGVFAAQEAQKTRLFKRLQYLS